MNLKNIKYICLGGVCLLLLGAQSFAQSKETKVTLKPGSTKVDNTDPNEIEEEKSIEFYIVGIKDENDVWAVEDLLTKQKGIDRARVAGNNGFCTVITLKGSDISEKDIMALMSALRFTINNYSERWIAQKFSKPGERVYIQETPSQRNDKGKPKNTIEEKE